jgi:hypothetical protein
MLAFTMPVTDSCSHRLALDAGTSNLNSQSNLLSLQQKYHSTCTKLPRLLCETSHKYYFAARLYPAAVIDSAIAWLAHWPRPEHRSSNETRTTAHRALTYPLRAAGVGVYPVLAINLAHFFEAIFQRPSFPPIARLLMNSSRYRPTKFV